jgi:hypothetical protein
VAFAVPSGASLKMFCAPVAVGRPLAESGCGLRSCAARRIVIDCFLTTQSITCGLPAPDILPPFRALDTSGFLWLFLSNFYV